MRQILLVASLLLVAMSIAWIAANAQNSSANDKAPRFARLTLEQLSDQQRPLAEKILKISSVRLAGP